MIGDMGPGCYIRIYWIFFEVFRNLSQYDVYSTTVVLLI